METILIMPCGYSPLLQNLLNTAYKVRNEYPNEKIILLGGLLNADQVKKELKTLSIDIIDIPSLGFNDFLRNLNNDTIVLTSPYGATKTTLATLKKENFRFFETTSTTIKNKINFINNSKGKFNIIYLGNTNTVEAWYLSGEAKFSFLFYDVNDPSKAKSVISPAKFNKSKTHIIYQSELSGSAFDATLNYLKETLPKATIEHELSDDNYERKKNLDSTLNNNDVVLFISTLKTQEKYLLDYYHLSTRNLLYSVISSVDEAMALKIPAGRRVILVADGSVPEPIVINIYQYFYYKGLAASLPETQK